MSDSRKAALRIVGSVVFVLGLLLFLAETRSTGESLETFKLFVSSDVASIVGGAVAMLAAAELIFLYFWGRKKTTTKHPLRHA